MVGAHRFRGGGRGGIRTDDPSTTFGGGASAGVDFNSLGWVPIGVLLVGKTDAFTKNAADLASRSWIYGFSVAFTGWDDFVLSLETTTHRLEPRDEGDPFEAFLATFNLRYWPS